MWSAAVVLLTALEAVEAVEVVEEVVCCLGVVGCVAPSLAARWAHYRRAEFKIATDMI